MTSLTRAHLSSGQVVGRCAGKQRAFASSGAGVLQAMMSGSRAQGVSASRPDRLVSSCQALAEHLGGGFAGVQTYVERIVPVQALTPSIMVQRGCSAPPGLAPGADSALDGSAFAAAGLAGSPLARSALCWSVPGWSALCCSVPGGSAFACSTLAASLCGREQPWQTKSPAMRYLSMRGMLWPLVANS